MQKWEYAIDRVKSAVCGGGGGGGVWKEYTINLNLLNENSTQME